MTIEVALFSKASDEWTTPKDVFDRLNAEFQFCVDVSATTENALTPYWFGLGSLIPDALASECWGVDGWILAGESFEPTFWCNPPYSKCRAFLAKIVEEVATGGKLVVALVPARTDTRWWHTYVWDATRHQPREGVEVRFLRGRLKFSNSTNTAPFPSCLIIFRPVR